ncbi:MAG TPA: DNA translocase FtsK 4TM domain-containing protein, partial [Phycisphaerae bacterium]|nr:DNA translocase FtsK 4TM domain-containing protein [Phycisphaerae bacterium]
MARKSSNPNRAAVIRVIFMMGVWVLYLLFALSCISYQENDSAVRMVNGPIAYHNWCGAVGARIAAGALGGIGPGIFVGIALLGVAMAFWTRGMEITQLPLRIIGAAMLVAVVSTLFNMCSSAADAGGNLGIALGSLLFLYFKHGGWLILLMSLVVSALLVADEIVLKLPAKLLWVGKRLPAEQVAGAAAGAAGGMWGGMKSIFETLTRKDRAKRVKRKDAAGAEAARMTIPAAPETGATAVAEAPAAMAEVKEDEVEEGTVTVVATPVKAEKGEKAEIEVRKPEPPKGPSVPFRPIPPQSQKQDLGNYRLPGLELLDEPEPVDTAGQEQRV